MTDGKPSIKSSTNVESTFTTASTLYNSSIPSDDSFFANILTPGSSSHPTFELILDFVFVALLMVLAALAATVSSGAPHFLILFGIAVALWLSVKWVLRELRTVEATAERRKDE
ncbi:hypothetical protein FISHEDRAFT_72872 [Fistulina hepatica ATCC 64428]|nr:hypothetical protein FISHEDRAFT_72872 [Fistulina hepatica ATCC 64428]